MLVITFVAEPLTVSAAWADLSAFGSTNNLVSYAVKNTDTVRFSLYLENAQYNIYLGRFDSDSRGGLPVSVNQLALQGREVLSAFIRDALSAWLEAVLADKDLGPKVVGTTFSLSYAGEHRPGSITVFWNRIYFTCIRRADGTLAVTDPTCRVDLTVAVTYSIEQGIFIPGIASAELVQEDTQSNPIAVYDSAKSTLNYWDPLTIVNQQSGYVGIATDWIVNPHKGKLRLRYQDGSEEVADLSNGQQLIAYSSPPATAPYRRLGSAPKRSGGNIVLAYESADSETVSLERSTDLKSWALVSGGIVINPPVLLGSSSSVVRIRTATVPFAGNLGFFRATVGTTSQHSAP